MFKNIILKKPLLILDLDETLIYATKNVLSRKPNFKVFNYHIYIRPYLNEFIKEISKSYKLAIWSSAGNEYVNAIVDRLLPTDISLEFIWGRSKTVKRTIKANIDDIDYDNEVEYIKPLKKVKKLGYEIEKILIVDDSPHKSKLNYGNAIYPTSYKGDIEDKELLDLLQFLNQIKNIKNFRTIEKRNWKLYDQ